MTNSIGGSTRLECGVQRRFGFGLASPIRISSESHTRQSRATHRRWSLATVGLIALSPFVFQQNANADPARDHWSFRKPVRQAIPAEAGHPIDYFIDSRLKQKALPAAPSADKRTLARRATFDLVGLPPSPEDVESFVSSDSPDAWLKLIDRLLDSPQYGERWGRHWLDVARYADSGGYETDIYYRNAWRYRDYVVKSFNDDKPYDQFVQEQIAGDEIWPDNLDLDPKRVYLITEEQRRHLEARTGTGFFTIGPRVHESGLDAKRLRYETLTDWVDTAASAFLGLTMGCARCHDHKFDPLSQRDYFAMQAIFAGSIAVEEPIVTSMEIADREQHYPRVLAVDEARQAYRLFEKRTSGQDITAAESKEKSDLLAAIGRAVLNLPERAAGQPNSPYDGLMEIPTVSILGYARPELVRPVHRLDRGELQRTREPMEPGLPAVFAQSIGNESLIKKAHGRRKAFALWLTQADHPLTARVMVNRVWQWHFGRALVETPNDFGKMGEPPSHPKLLDWLATEFFNQGWSIKAMHRLIMTSKAYQRQSRFGTGRHFEKDPDNRLLWKMNRRRLEAEALWDAVHAVAGTLNLKMGGRPVVPPLVDDEIAALRDKWHWPISADPSEHTRRGIYVLVRRNFRFPMFEVFDAPITSVSCPERDVTTVAPQALWSLNNRSVNEQAGRFAARVIEEAGPDTKDQIKRVWLMALAREPSAQELQEAGGLLEKFEQGDDDTKVTALSTLCLAIYNLSEFAFID